MNHHKATSKRRQTCQSKLEDWFQGATGSTSSNFAVRFFIGCWQWFEPSISEAAAKFPKACSFWKTTFVFAGHLMPVAPFKLHPYRLWWCWLAVSMILLTYMKCQWRTQCDQELSTCELFVQLGLQGGSERSWVVIANMNYRSIWRSVKPCFSPPIQPSLLSCLIPHNTYIQHLVWIIDWRLQVNENYIHTWSSITCVLSTATW